MSADNCLAILHTSDGTFRVADIHMIWLNEPDRIERLMSWAEIFNASPVFSGEDAAYDHADALMDEDLFIEYGIELFKVEASWEEFYSQSISKNLCRGISGRCETCQSYSHSLRRFEQIRICPKCRQIFG